MARDNYSFKKHQKELARKKKHDEKLARKLAKKNEKTEADTVQVATPGLGE